VKQITGKAKYIAKYEAHPQMMHCRIRSQALLVVSPFVVGATEGAKRIRVVPIKAMRKYPQQHRKREEWTRDVHQ
jgi:hypothetical protein